MKKKLIEGVGKALDEKVFIFLCLARSFSLDEANIEISNIKSART